MSNVSEIVAKIIQLTNELADIAIKAQDGSTIAIDALKAKIRELVK